MAKFIEYKGGFFVNEAILKETIEKLVNDELISSMAMVARNCVHSAVKEAALRFADEASKNNYQFFQETIDLVNKYVSENINKDVINFLAEKERYRCNKHSLSEDITKWDISVRAKNCLKNSGIERKKQLLALSKRELLKIPNFGKLSLNEIERYILPLELEKSSCKFSSRMILL